MVILQSQIFISRDHFKVFMEVSHDRNPLHTDNSYAQRTFLGQIIFFGMGSVLLTLAAWAQGKPFRLLSIQGTFHRPLLVGHLYDIEITKEGSKINARIMEHSALMCTVRWEAEVLDNTFKEVYSDKCFTPLRQARELTTLGVNNIQEYAFNPKYMDQLKRLFGLSLKQIPRVQLTTLLWASYFIGMEYPGRRAFFSDFSFNFITNKKPFKILKLKSVHHKAYDLVEISGKTTCLSSLNLRAYLVPEAVHYSIDEISSAIGKSKKLKDKIIFISGAARGFGSVLSKTLALQGATVLLNCKSTNASILETIKEIHSIGGTCHLIETDLATDYAIESVYQQVSSCTKKIDWIINNASPKITFRKFKEQTTTDFLSIVEESLSIVLNTCYSLFPLLKEKGWVFGISSGYLNQPRPGFSHYLATKSALEGLLLGLAQEYPRYNFAVFRPPRMLTDQTNTVADLNPPVSVIEVAKHFLNAIAGLHTSGNFIQL